MADEGDNGSTGEGDEGEGGVEFTTGPHFTGEPLPTREQALEALRNTYGENADNVLKISKEMLATFVKDDINEIDKSGIGNDPEFINALYALSQEHANASKNSMVHVLRHIEPQYRLHIGQNMQQVDDDRAIAEMPLKIKKAIHEARVRQVAKHGPQERT